MKIVLATGNRGKISEIRRILSDIEVQVLTFEDFDSFPDPEETGSSFLANSLIKAKAVSEATGLPALADDSGLEVDWLNGGPGIMSARYGGEGLDDRRRYLRLLEEMEGVPEHKRGARFRCVMTFYPAPAVEILPQPPGAEADEIAELLGDDEKALVTEGFLYGRVAEEPAGEGGFGYDPVFYIPEEGKTAAQLRLEEKNRISHRYRALVEMKRLIRRYCLSAQDTQGSSL
ncbi:MAG: non-canonical purine NTP pyrophosphatase [Candidatus Latescibacteria bacterium]|nr:non-canonical purine NTP pyrophosphatase [bacterium]MBD3423639.1 non-canonical purine NTP pyrophosphatase [Candidatus Latescibacterota bacterium]